MSSRDRFSPWFRIPGDRYKLATEPYNHEWLLFLFLDSSEDTEGPFYCERCHSNGDDVRKRVLEPDMNCTLVNGVLRFAPPICDKCAVYHNYAWKIWQQIMQAEAEGRALSTAVPERTVTDQSELPLKMIEQMFEMFEKMRADQQHLHSRPVAWKGKNPYGTN